MIITSLFLLVTIKIVDCVVTVYCNFVLRQKLLRICNSNIKKEQKQTRTNKLGK